MRRFICPTCQQELHFENSACLNCGSYVGYDPEHEFFLTLPGGDTVEGHKGCANRDAAGCNWLVAPGDGAFCIACRHNRTVPDLDVAGNAAHWRDIEQAKRFLFYSLLKWRLPHPTEAEADNGLAFDFLADMVAPDGTMKRVLTGHDNGLITLNIAEGDDAEREARRSAMGEPYRTLIGHMRHEVGHYYWEVLVRDGGQLEACREMFGDDRLDYAKALQANYETGPRPGWQDAFISSYAAVHPWEDFAETWAHYIHITDALETAHAFGMTLHENLHGTEEISVASNPYLSGTAKDLLEDFVPLTVAVNCLNRSLGQPDFYPFVLSAPVEQKLGFIHDLVRGAAQTA